MSITALNGSLIDTNKIEYDVKFNTILYLYVKYTKGDETSIDITFQVYDENNPLSEEFYIIERKTDKTIEKYKFILTESGNYIIPCPSPESAEFITIVIDYTGGSSGDIQIFGNSSNKYM